MIQMKDFQDPHREHGSTSENGALALLNKWLDENDKVHVISIETLTFHPLSAPDWRFLRVFYEVKS